MPRVYIKQMQVNQLVQGIFAIQNCQLGLTRGGKPYIKALLADKSGRAPARMWNTTEELFNTLPTDGFVYVDGQTQPFQGEMQIIINSIRKVEPTEADLKDLLPTTKKDVTVMFSDLSKLMSSLKHPGIKALAAAYLADQPLMEKFKSAPAAMNLHHAMLGGLLEHTLQLLQLAEKILPLYPLLNRDLILMGLFLHDLGKCEELIWAKGFAYSDDGQLVGHIARGIIWLQKKVDALRQSGTEIPESVVMVLHHIILSHHGKPEFGALKLPATPEAIAVAMIDNFDAKLFMALEAVAEEPSKTAELGGNFTEKIWALEGVRLYKPDPTLD